MSIQRKKVMVSVGGTVVLLSILGFVMYPLTQGIVRDYHVLLSGQKELAVIERDMENILEFKRISLAKAAEFSELKSLFINSDTPIPFIEFLELASQTSQLDLRIVPGNPKQIKGDPWPSMDFQLNLEGDYPDFIQFVEMMESAPYLVELRNITIRKLKAKPGETAEQGGEFSLFIKAYTR